MTMLTRWMMALAFGLTMMAGVFAAPSSANAQSTDRYVDYYGGWCRICSGQTYACSNNHGTWSNGQRSFYDPVPSGYRAIRVEYNMEGVYGCSGSQSRIEGRLNSWYFGAVYGRGQCRCNSCDGWTRITSSTYNGGLPGYRYRSNNTVYLRLSSGLSCIARVRVRLHYRRTTRTCYRDADGDGYGNRSVTSQRTSCSGGWVTNSSDCNDGNRNIRPGAREVCNNVDDDCDGSVDEGLKRYYYYDYDNDSYGTSSRSYRCSPSGYYRATLSGDCDDRNSRRRPGLAETCDYLDNDCDGAVDEGVNRLYYYDYDGDSYGTNSNLRRCGPTGYYRASRNGDCNDRNRNVNPGRAEVCGNNIDDNCNGQIDENKVRFYRDYDGDGYGDPRSSGLFCSRPGGYVTNNRDCNDRNRGINPGAREVCDNADNDCDGSIDEGYAHRYYYYDYDNDGYGTSSRIYECKAYGYHRASSSGDCDDRRSNVRPGLAEVCGDGLDNNCNGQIDENRRRFYRDADRDGYGNPGSSTLACTQPSGYVTNNRDCNDGNRNAYPGAREVCDNVDNDCDGLVDEGLKRYYYLDADRDGYGRPGGTRTFTTSQGRITRNWTYNNLPNAAGNVTITVFARGDINSSSEYLGLNIDGTRFADVFRFSTCYNCWRSQNVTVSASAWNARNGDRRLTFTVYNRSGVGWADTYLRISYPQGPTYFVCPGTPGYSTRNDDCNDSRSNVNPGHPEVCGDGLDNNCNGRIDENIQTFYRDADGDGYGNPGSTRRACTRPSGYVTNNRDCNDGNRNINPGAREVCDNADNDCDGSIDEGFAHRYYYYDYDNDGYGTNSRIYECKAYGYHRANRNGDCNDRNGSVNPGRAEVCGNGIDDNCDGRVDENLRTFYRDADRDGWGGASRRACTQPSGYVTRGGDCNDNTNLAYPGRTEVCDNIDNDCDGQTDEGLRTYQYLDSDRDGYGRPGGTRSFTTSQGRITRNWTYNNLPNAAGNVTITVFARGDINSSSEYLGLNIDGTRFADVFRFSTCYNCWRSQNVTVSASAWNARNGDRRLTFTVYNRSGVGWADTYLRISYPQGPQYLVCPGSAGYATNDRDCNDGNRNVNPGRSEVCGNNIDDNCNGQIDENILTFYRDGDGDGFGNPSSARRACTRPGGYVTNNRDCNDGNSSVYPGAREVCNNIDDDCDRQIDEGLRVSLYRDNDRDGYAPSPGNYSTQTSQIYRVRGQFARYGLSNLPVAEGNVTLDVWGNGDLNSSSEYLDVRLDGTRIGYAFNYGTSSYRWIRHRFTVSAAFWNARIGDNFANLDIYLSSSVGSATVYAQISYSTGGGTVSVCPGTPGYTNRLGDCNDRNASVNPGRAEVCGNNIDDNCNGQVDENLRTFYRDADGDTYGTTSSTRACSQPRGYATRPGDCNDGNRNVYPGAREVCNNIDDDCDRQIDEGLRVNLYRDNDRDGYAPSPGNYSTQTSQIYRVRGQFARYGLSNLPVAAGNVTLDVWGNGDLNSSSEYLDVRLDGTRIGYAFNYGTSSYRWIRHRFTVSAAFWNARIGDNFANLDIYLSSSVGSATVYAQISYSTGGGTVSVCPGTPGYTNRQGDCNDFNNRINPGASEVCGNGVDDNCNGQIDENRRTFYRDVDGDSYGNSGSTTRSCTRPSGYADRGGDCNDNNRSVNPGAREVCNGIDDNCNGQRDEGLLVTRYRDTDGDGFGTTSGTVCPGTSGWATRRGDCNDGNASIYPGARELCDNLDNDCDSQVDEGLRVTRYVDGDRDGYGRNTTASVCPQWPGYSTNNRDCNDSNASVNPGRAEVCGNNIDDNCDGRVDENKIRYYRDRDNDSYGDNASTTLACTRPNGYATRGGDCDDGRNNVFPGAQEVCDGLDNDCDGTTDEGLLVRRYRDADGDGYGATSRNVCPNQGGYTTRAGDCDDSNRNINPGAAEVCGNGVDDNCNGQIDENRLTFYIDRDGDSYGDVGTTTRACSVPSGYSARGGDCNDRNRNINPGAREICDNIDNNCNSTIDEGLRVTRYRDADGDTWGSNTTGNVCPQWTGWSSRNGDCNDGNADIRPNALEVCDLIDNNCNGTIDEGGDGGRTYTIYPTQQVNLSYNTTWFSTRQDLVYAYDRSYSSRHDIVGWLGFDLSQIPDDAVVESVTLSMWQDSRYFSGSPYLRIMKNDVNNWNSGVRQNGMPKTNDYVSNQFTTFQSNARNNFAINTESVNWTTELQDNWLSLGVDQTRSVTGSQRRYIYWHGRTYPTTSRRPYIQVRVRGTSGTLQVTRYRDADGDNYGGSSAQVCTDTAGYVNQPGDCNDNNVAVNPGVAEVCGNNIDDNCNGQIDENKVRYYRDGDRDGFGSNVSTLACTQPGGYVTNNRDCNDGNPDINPDADEVCNGVDDNCAGGVDEGLPTRRYYRNVDGDSYGTAQYITRCGPSGVYNATETGDCDDTRNFIFPGASERCGNNLDDNCNGQIDENKLRFYRDIDGDTYGGTTSTLACTQPNGYVARTGDCDDRNGDINPGATEVCDYVDNNCRNGIDEGVRVTRFRDNDRDNYGTTAGSVCAGQVGWATEAGDCNDNNPSINPGATEVCDYVDNNCAGGIDEGLRVVLYRDADSDTYGTNQTSNLCPGTAGWTNRNGDCNDGDRNVNPGVAEVCGNNIDDNCNGQIDENKLRFYRDLDSDGFGNVNAPTLACTQPSGYVTNGRDCNDDDGDINPDADEICNGIDDNCDGSIDEGIATRLWYRDADNDSYGTSSTIDSCRAVGLFRATRSGDCNDSNDDINPGVSEVCANNIDDNCNGTVDEGTLTYYRDRDGDGFGNRLITTRACAPVAGYVLDSTDCDDTRDNVNPDAAEVCDNLDNNCDGAVDEGLEHRFYHRDSDGDTWGVDTRIYECKPYGDFTATRNGDCNDGNRNINPDAAEICGNGVDDNCDGSVDENIQVWYLDSDGDTYGSSLSARACTQPRNYVARSGDCNDNNSDVNPAADEVCNGIDDNCVDGVDEGLLVTRFRDSDGDTYGSSRTSQVCPDANGYADRAGDCDDTRDFIYPGADELCGNNLDDNCNGQVDENTRTFFRDFDGDGFGNAANTRQACVLPSGYVTDNTDCNDGERLINPDASERCNGIDDNCNDTTDEGNPEGGDQCDTGLPGVCAATSTTVCIEGTLVCGPQDEDGFGEVSTVTVGAGLLGRRQGVVNSDYKLITSNGTYLFNLAFGRNGGTYNGYSVRVFDPADNMALLKEFQVGTASDYIDGINARGNTLYAVQWTGGNGARVTEIDWRNERILRTTTHNQGNTQSIEGQYDWINDVHWMGALRRGARVYEHRGDEISSSSLVRTIPVSGIGEGAGTVASDGRFLYVKRWGSYSGTTALYRIGTGYGNTVRGLNYGLVAEVGNTLSTTYHSDGYVYVGRTNSNALTRVQVTGSRVEICGDDIDNNCNGGIDDYCPNEEPFDDFDGGLVRCNWNVSSTHGGDTQPEVANGVLKAKLGTGVSGQAYYASGLTSRFQLNGDFDVTVDYSIVRWNGENGVHINLSANDATAHRLNQRGGNDFYLANFDSNLVGQVATNDQSGKLRLVRTGTTMVAYRDDAGWREIGRRTGMSTGATAVTLSIHGQDALPANAEVHFDNFTVRQGDVVAPQPFGPEVCDGEDNNCDGTVDEDANVTCSTACGDGVRVCEGGTLQACTARLPTDEVCDDGIDNDCNGTADEFCGGFTPFDDFEDGNLAPCRWDVATSPAYNQGNDSGVRVDESGGKLRVRFARNTRGANFSGSATTRFGVEGDFDFQVDYALPTWPARNHIRMGLVATGLGSVIRASDRDNGETYVADVGGAFGWRPTTSREGRLRLIRQGNTVRALAMDGLNGSWVQLGARTVSTDDVRIGLTSWGHDFVTGDVEVHYDNLTFNNCNDDSCRAWPGGGLVSFGGVGTPEGAFDATTCDGIDNDCDGITDGFARACETACGVGEETCVLGNWGTCSAQMPIAEICDGQDNDCDGDVDEEDPNEGTFCTVSGQQGVCAQGTKVCRGAQGLICEGPSPSVEVCDNADNDCDGQTDEVGNSPDVFASSDLVGYWSFEEANGSSFRDNAGDNNAGTVQLDARLGRAGRYGKGLELDGTGDHGLIPAENTELDMDRHNRVTIAGWFFPRRHSDRAYAIYRGGSYYLTMINGRPAFYGYGLATPGYHTAPSALPLNQWSHVAASMDGTNVRIYLNGNLIHTSSVGGGAFSDDSGPLVFGHRSNSTDTAFNGFIDEVVISRAALSQAEIQALSAPDMPGGGVQCDTGNLGVCSPGLTVCNAGSFACEGESPSAELCDGLDNNCDGSVDEGNPQGGGSCVTNNPGVCRVGTFLCAGGALTCDAPQPGTLEEVCDGADNDCDGQTDETFPTEGDNCNTGRQGVCAFGQQRCLAGNEVCVGPSPTAETCDNQDNNCNGQVDEELTRACSTDCGGGVETCSAGDWGGCTARQPTAEVCDGEDNDCDGQTDESIRRACRTACGGGTQVCTDGDFGLCSAPLPSTELCDGQDNDCNGFIDDSVDCGCQYFPRDEPVRPSLEWMWTDSSFNSDSRQVMMTPVVGPLVDSNNDGRVNEDDVPTILFTTTTTNYRAGGTLRAVRGDDGTEMWNYEDRLVAGASSPAIADLDDDGQPEIVAYAWRDLGRGAPDNAGLVAIDAQGNELWNNTDVNQGGHFEMGSPAVANIDPNRDGNEIATCFWLIDAQGNTIWNQWGNLPNGYTPRGFCSPAVADVDGDGFMEIVIGSRAYNHDGTILWTNAQVTNEMVNDYDIAPAIADLDGDGRPEVILVRGSVYVLDGATGALMARSAIPGGGQGGAPNVADFDGDGQPEVGTAGGNSYAVFKMTRVNNVPTLNIMWQRTTRDFSSSITGSSVFDFNGDGVADVVYNDELYLRIYNGQTGEVTFEERNWSGTLVEYPVIVDADNDGNAEIIVGRNQIGGYQDDYGDYDGTPVAGLRVYGDANDNWVNTRGIWNQYTYHITNINSNGSVPIEEALHWEQRNSNGWRNNFQGDQGLFSAPDLAIDTDSLTVAQGADAGNFPNTDVAYCDAYVRMTVDVCNEGDVAVPAGVQLGIYIGHPDNGVALSSGTTSGRLESGACEPVTVEWNSEVQGNRELFLMIDAGENHNECDEDNNVRSLGSFSLIALTEEKCDSEDNDCNGVVDEDLVRTCSNECGNSEETCEDGEWVGCRTPAPELCNGIDDDCDNVVDEDPEDCPSNTTCVHDSLNDDYVCVEQLEVEGNDCGFGCPLGTVCDGQACVPHCESDASCPNGEVCSEGNICAPVPDGFGAVGDDEDGEPIATPLGACSASSFSPASSPAGGMAVFFLFLFGALVFIRRRR